MQIFLKVASNENDGEIMRGNVPDSGTVPSRVRSSLSTEFKQRNIFKKKQNIIDDSDDSGNYSIIPYHLVADLIKLDKCANIAPEQFCFFGCFAGYPLVHRRQLCLNTSKYVFNIRNVFILTEIFYL